MKAPIDFEVSMDALTNERFKGLLMLDVQKDSLFAFYKKKRTAIWIGTIKN